MHVQQRKQTQEFLDTKGIKQALFANSHTVTWLTGFAPSVQLGTNLFAGGPPLVWYDDGHFDLIILDAHAGDASAFGEQSNCELHLYSGYTIEQPITSVQNLAQALDKVLRQSKPASQIGIEQEHLPVSLLAILRQVSPQHCEWVPCDGWLVPLRMVKTAEELTTLRQAFSLTDIGHQAAKRATQAGVREIDVWTEIHQAVEQAAGQRVPLGNDCVISHRQNNIGGWPLDLLLESQDSLIVDLSVLWQGYWSDSCATYYATEPTEAQSTMHRAIQEALDYAISLMKPGAIASEIDQKVRQFVEKRGFPVYPHHTGHGVGVSGHEEPRIVPYSEISLRKNMVIMLEPGTYFAGEAGVRLEDAVLITADGCEILTRHEKGLPEQ